MTKHTTKQAFTKEQVQELIANALFKGDSLEYLAFTLNKSFGTIYRWYKGKGMPSKGDYELLKRTVERL